MQSITQENDLDAFLSTAALAETDFTAGKHSKLTFFLWHVKLTWCLLCREIERQSDPKRLPKSLLDL